MILFDSARIVNRNPGFADGLDDDFPPDHILERMARDAYEMDRLCGLSFGEGGAL